MRSIISSEMVNSGLPASISEPTPPAEDTHDSTEQGAPRNPSTNYTPVDHIISSSTQVISQSIPGSTPFWTAKEADIVKPSSITRNIVALPKPLTEFTLFMKLPMELRTKIYNLALRTQAVWVSRSTKSRDRQIISMVSKESKGEYERQYKILKKRASELRPRFGPVFVNYRDDYVHFFRTNHDAESPAIDWAGIMAKKVERGFDLIRWLKPAQRVAIRLRMSTGNKGLCGPRARHEVVWEQFSRICPLMKELIFIIAERGFAMGELVELEGFGGQIGVGEAELRSSFRAAQEKGLNASARLVVMGSPKSWSVSKGKLLEVVDLLD